MGGQLNQLRLLLWKNFLLKRRQPGAMVMTSSSRGIQPWRICRLWMLVVCCVCLQWLACGVQASAGDRDPAYSACRRQCALDRCRHGESVAAWRAAFGWSCEDDCSYSCIHSVTERRLASGQSVLQYHGKWPFYRLCSVIQEPASVLFSLMNLAANLAGLRWFRTAPSAREYPMFVLYHMHCLVSSNAWLWSTVFHSRDLLLTERLDYFSATAVVLFSAYCSLVRMALLRRPVLRLVVTCCLSLLFLLHCGYLALVKFDYGYNMAANVTVAGVNMCLWLLWCVGNVARQRYVWKCVAVLVLTAMLMSLELFDFPPVWFVFDAHSLWHLGTSPLPLLWFSFLADDAQFMAKEREKVL